MADRIESPSFPRLSRGDMTDRIEPALSAEEWAEASAPPPHGAWFELDELGLIVEPESRALAYEYDSMHLRIGRLPALIALANAVLKDDDRRKITRGLLFDLHEVIANFRAAYLRDDQAGAFGRERLEEYARGAEQLEALLASYLPPETP